MENKIKNKKHIFIPLKDKAEAIRDIKNKKCSIFDVADKFNVHHTTVRLWLKSVNEVEQQVKEWKNHPDGILFRRKRKPRVLADDSVSRAVWLWFKETRSQEKPISTSIILDQASKFHSAIKKVDNDVGNTTEKFCADEGWLKNWVTQYGVNVDGESSANAKIHNSFKSTFMRICEKNKLSADQVFSCDVGSLNYKILPKTLFSGKNEDTPLTLKSYKDRLCILACANASGSLKLPLVVVGKSSKPRCFKHTSMSDLPVSYRSQKNAWLTEDIFSKWLKVEFVPAVTKFLSAAGLPPKALLLIENFTAEKYDFEDKGISVMFYPTNTTSLHEPTDQGRLQYIKLLYKEELMDFILLSIDENPSIYNIIKEISVYDAVYWLSSAWYRLNEPIIQNSWNKAWRWEDRVKTCELFETQKDYVDSLFNKFVAALRKFRAFKRTSDEDMDQWLRSTKANLEECLNVEEIIQIINEEENKLNPQNSNRNDENVTKKLSNKNSEELTDYDEFEPVEMDQREKVSNDTSNKSSAILNDHCYNQSVVIHKKKNASNGTSRKESEILNDHSDDQSLVLNNSSEGNGKKSNKDLKRCIDYLREHSIKNKFFKSIGALTVIERELGV